MDRFEIEKQLWEEGYLRVMGLDEAGRGCLSGPVVAAGVIFAPGSGPGSGPGRGKGSGAGSGKDSRPGNGTGLEELRDSKTLKLTDRERLATLVKERAAWWTVRRCSPGEIDELNILQASLRAMVRCTEQEGGEPDFLLVDGNRFPAGPCPHRCLVGGDDRSASIAAASILAKVHRDRLMKELHEEYPHYGWKTNVGYPTHEHYRGLAEYGITPHHRRSFRLGTQKVYGEG